MISRKGNTSDPRPILATNIVIDGMILALWRQKLDTYAIAKQLNLREHDVANKLWRLRSAA